MTIGTATSIFGDRHALTPGKIASLRGCGIDSLEIAALQERHLCLYDNERVEQLVGAVAGSGLRVWSLHAPFCGIALDDEETRVEGVRSIKKSVEVAHRFGAKCVVVHPGRDIPSADRPRELRWIIDNTLLAVQGLPDGIRIALETMGGSSLGAPPDEMAYLMDNLPEDKVGICLDSGHVNLGGDAVAFIKRFGSRIITVHLHDNDGKKDLHILPGNAGGMLDWPEIITALRVHGYQGPLINEGGDGASGEHPAEMIKRYTAFMTSLYR